MKVKYNNRKTFTLIDGYEDITLNRVRLTGKNAMNNTSGFDVYNDKEQKLYPRQDYTVVYEVGDGYVEYTSDQNTYYVFDIYNEDKYVTGQQISTTSYVPNGILRKSGQGKAYAEAEPTLVYTDEEGFFNYKVIEIKPEEEEGRVELVIAEVTKEEKDAWREEAKQAAYENALSAKLTEISAASKAAIVKGIDLNDSHYSYETEDQNNISNAVTLANQTKLAVPYHADGESCRLYEPDEITSIYVLEETNLTHNVTYHNQLKLYIQTLTTKDEIEEIKYGETELTGEYLDTYNMIMAQAQKVIRHFIGENNMPAAVDEESPVEVPESPVETPENSTEVIESPVETTENSTETVESPAEVSKDLTKTE